MVNQVHIVGILMIVQGALASLMGVAAAVMGPLWFMLMSQAMQNQPKNSPPPPPEFMTMFKVISVLYVVGGILVLIAGILNIIGGIRCMKFRSRTFVLVALFSNILPVMTFYCAPTGLGVMIYGLIVMFNGEVIRAFAMVEEGYTPEQIREHFGQ